MIVQCPFARAYVKSNFQRKLFQKKLRFLSPDSASIKFFHVLFCCSNTFSGL